MIDRETHEQRVERLIRDVADVPTMEGTYALGKEDARAVVERIIASDREAGYVTVPVDLLKDCADELEAWVQFAYPEDSRKYPSEARRYVRDMEPVARLRAALAAHEPK